MDTDMTQTYNYYLLAGTQKKNLDPSSIVHREDFIRVQLHDDQYCLMNTLVFPKFDSPTGYETKAALGGVPLYLVREPVVVKPASLKDFYMLAVPGSMSPRCATTNDALNWARARPHLMSANKRAVIMTYKNERLVGSSIVELSYEAEWDV